MKNVNRDYIASGNFNLVLDCVDFNLNDIEGYFFIVQDNENKQKVVLYTENGRMATFCPDRTYDLSNLSNFTHDDDAFIEAFLDKFEMRIPTRDFLLNIIGLANWY